MATHIVWTPALLEKFWAYYSQFPETYFSYSKSADLVRRASKHLAPQSRVLDYGCGAGYLMPHLLKAGHDVWGGDISDKVIGDVVKTISSDAKFHGVHPFETLKGRVSFDAVTLLEVVEHLDDAALTAVTNDVYELLRPGGVLIVTTPNDERLEDQMVYCPISDVTFHRWQHVRSWTKDSLPAHLRKSGFTIVSAEEVNFRDDRDVSSLPRKIARSAIEMMRKKAGLMVVAKKPA